jgi:hypothetical protein
MTNYEPLLVPPVDKGIRLLELGIYECASPRFWRDYFEIAAAVRLGWIMHIPFYQTLTATVRHYFEAGK